MSLYKFAAMVTNVVDGDTVDLVIDLGFKIVSAQRVRLNGVDTPERGQPGYAEARDYVKDRVLGKTILVETFKVSKFGYYLADLYEGVSCVNDDLVALGLAKEYNGGSKG